MSDIVKVKLKNCKNIINGEIAIYKNVLNVKYVNNGTGKSTIAEAIKYYTENNLVKIDSLKSYGINEESKVSIFNQDSDSKEEENENTILSNVETFFIIW